MRVTATLCTREKRRGSGSPWCVGVIVVCASVGVGGRAVSCEGVVRVSVAVDVSVRMCARMGVDLFCYHCMSHSPSEPHTSSSYNSRQEAIEACNAMHVLLPHGYRIPQMTGAQPR